MQPQPLFDVDDVAPALSRAAPPLPPLAGLEPVAPFFAGDRRTIVLGLLRCADVVVIALAGSLSYAARHGSLVLPALYFWQSVAGCVVAAAALQGAGVYSFSGLRHRARHLSGVGLAWAASALLMIAALFFTKTADEVSRIWLLLWAVAGFAGLVGVRLAGWLWLARASQAGKLIFNVAVAGPPAAAERLARQVERASAGDVRVLGIFRTPSDGSDGDLEALAALARSVRIDEILIALPCAAGESIGGALRLLGALPADLKLCVDLENATAVGVPFSARPLLISQRPLAGWRIVVKRTMDLSFSVALLIVLAPLMALIALLVKLDSPGPVIFRQRRFGFNKQPFTVHKFRTMYGDGADVAVIQARRGDPRVTRIGRFLRRTSLDELPQLFDVLGGSMSLVGPRPHAIVHDEKYASMIDGYLARHRVLPGITGWAQVNGFRGETDTTEKMAMRIRHDLFYIDHWSPLLDLRILARTLRVGFCDRNAY